MWTLVGLLSLPCPGAAADHFHFATNAMSHGSRITSLLSVPLQNILISASSDGKLKFWNSQTNALVREMASSLSYVNAASFVDGGQTIAVAGAKGILIHHTETGKVLKQFRPERQVTHIDASSASELLAYSCWHGEIGLINLDSGKIVAHRHVGRPPGWPFGFA